MKNQYQFGKQLFEQQRSGELQIEQDDLERHLEQTYADRWTGQDLGHIQGLIWPGKPGALMNTEPPSLDEMETVVKKARAKSAPGPNGIPYTVYKRCPKTRKILYRLLYNAWQFGDISEQWNKA